LEGSLRQRTHENLHRSLFCSAQLDPLQTDIPQRKNFCLVCAELSSVVDDALADRLEVLDLLGPELREQLSQPGNVFAFSVSLVGAELYQKLIIRNFKHLKMLELARAPAWAYVPSKLVWAHLLFHIDLVAVRQ
jgi:hypothetical protein